MGQPNMVPMQITAAPELVPLPDGKVAIALVINCGASRYMLLTPADTVDQFIDNLATQVHTASAEARRHNSGLAIATPDELTKQLGPFLRPFQPPTPPKQR